MTLAAARAWVRLPSGRRLDLINPDPGAWLDSDLALRLARTYRWGGESSWPLPLSVAQHSLLVLALRRQWSDTPLPASDALLELLHDAEEGFLGFDCISPLKDVLGLSFRAVSSRLMAAVSERYELRAWSPAAHAVHKRADSVAAASEAVHCIGWAAHEVRDVLGIVHPVLDVDPLAEIYGCRPWEPWAADVAAERFLDALESLRVAARGQIEAQA
ncbi:phosphohydrolase [Burkholderia multivorans]|uniref:phosphohydrolase n=1 Tax=Burkholderia multivorans TaxID=87883 RepID=UPI001C24A189|nr:phosphohydrolase [Burkholderia multivorans]MBU9516551.1 phosphohydrolase [Burkholderia multivorans]